MRIYLDLLRLKGVARVMGSQLLARFPWGLVSLGFVIFFYSKFHSYAIAGIALGAQTVGFAVSGPLLGRKLVGWGIRPTLLIGASLASALMLAEVLLDLPAWLAVVFAALIGAVSPPVQSASRLTFPILVGEDKVSVLFAFDAISQEIIWVVGPVLATFLAALISPAAPLVAMAVFLMAGTIWFIRNPELDQIKVEEPEHRMGGVLKYPALLWVMAIGTLLVAGFSGVEIGTVGSLPKTAAGFAIGALSVGSIAGGIWFGHRTSSKFAMATFTSIMLLGYLLALVMPSNPWWLGFCWLIAGMGVARSLRSCLPVVLVLPPFWQVCWQSDLCQS